MPELTDPLTFEPIFKERIWGGRKLETLFGKSLPPDRRIGESWEIVDREKDQSVVRDGPLRGETLHRLWMEKRREIFGDLAAAPRFPLLIKLLDCSERLSLQVHPPAHIAGQLGGEPKTECWYIAAAESGADLYLGVRETTKRAQFERAVASGEAADHTNRIEVQSGDFYYIPSGRLHAIGAGNLIVEIQQNSDTTYRVFDWNRTDERGTARELHVEQSLASIDFNDTDPGKYAAGGEKLLSSEHFQVEHWKLDAPRLFAAQGEFAIGVVLDGRASMGTSKFAPGDFFLLPANCTNRTLASTGDATMLRITLPSSR